MKILIIRMYPDVLNINTYNCQELGLAKALVRKNNICDIVLYTNKFQYEEDIKFDNNTKKIHVYHLNAKSILKNAFYAKSLYEIAEKYDIVQSTEYDQIANKKLLNKLGEKLVIYHGPYLSKYTKGYKKKCIISDLYYMINNHFKNVQCIAKSKLAEELLQKKKFKNIQTIGVGLDSEKFDKNNIRNNVRIEQLVKEKKEYKYLLYVGKLEERRNIIYLIDVLCKLLKKKDLYKLIIVGKGQDEYVKKCWKYAKEKKVLDNIIYIESIKQEELPNLYNCVDVFLLPTQYEIFGMVLLEAMYFGVPIVTTLNGGSSMLINNKYGKICKLQDIDSWVDSVEELVMLREDEKIKISRYIKNNYTWDKLSERFLEVYKKMNRRAIK